MIVFNETQFQIHMTVVFGLILELLVLTKCNIFLIKILIFQ